MGATQLMNHSLEFEIAIFRKSEQRNVKGHLVAQLSPDRDKIVFHGGTTRRKSIQFEIDIRELGTLREMRLIIRQLLLMDGWRFVGTSSHRI